MGKDKLIEVIEKKAEKFEAEKLRKSRLATEPLNRCMLCGSVSRKALIEVDYLAISEYTQNVVVRKGMVDLNCLRHKRGIVAKPGEITQEMKTRFIENVTRPKIG